jgi:hypothetical protein
VRSHLIEVLDRALRESFSVEAPGDGDGQTLAAELVDDREHFQWSPLNCAISDEIVGPHVIGILRPQADTGPVIEPQSAPFRLSRRYFQPLTPPDALHPLGIDPPALRARQRGDAAIAIAAIFASQADDRRTQGRFIIPDQAPLALGGTGLADGTAGAPLRDSQPLLQMRHALAPAFGA